jgi:hypothetical protein
VLERLRTLNQKGHRRPIRNGTVLDTLRHDEELSRAELDGRALRELDAEGALPAEEQLVLDVLMPRELAIELRQPHDRVVRSHEVDRRPRAGDGSSGLAQVDDVGYFAYSTARVSRITVTLT